MYNISWSDVQKFKKPFINEIIVWLRESNIGKSSNKRLDITQCILNIVEQLELSINKIKQFRNLCNTFPKFKEGNIWKQIENHFKDNDLCSFCKKLSNCRPKGIDTSPNAACGKYELMYRLLRPKSCQPNKGDILDESENIEIKGETGKSGGGGIRLSSTILGKNYCENNIQIFNNSPFKGNNSLAKCWLETNVWEIEKPKWENHYKTEFSKNINLAKNLLSKYLYVNFKIKIDDIEILFPNQIWSWKVLFNILLENFYITDKKKGYDSLYIFGNGTNLKIIKTIKDLDKLNYEADYFRIGQNAPVGYYIN